MFPTLTALALSLSLSFGPMVSHAVAPTAKLPSDSEITNWIHYALTHDPLTVTSDIAVETRDGIVKLMGEVDNLAAKNFAIAESKKISGVRGIIDEIDVIPPYRPDKEIAVDVQRRLDNSMAVDARNLTVAVHDGVVTLSGEAPDWNQKEEARFLTSEVRGVKRVVDHSRVHYGENISDERLAAESKALLLRDVYLADLPIDVTVTDGVVTLTGSVGNLYEKERAGRRLRWQHGVKSVVNDLKVEQWEGHGARKNVPVPSDAELKKNVETELNADLRLRPEDISIDAVAGHVMLFGSVPSLREKRIAERDVRDVVGVAWVTNDLMVYPTYRDDAGIRDQIVFNIGTDPYLSQADIHVSVDEGIVTLSGSVSDSYQKHRADDLAIDVSGVKQVVNDITVKPTPELTDDLLKSQVVHRLEEDWKLASTFQDIGVRVEAGTVTLTGDVNTWSERQEAERVSLCTQGVWAVDNRLTVRGVPYPWSEWNSKPSGYFGQSCTDDLYYPYTEDGS